jgi:hypothetical protein
MANISSIILPAIITIIGNIIFYLFIKGRIDNAIERQKIAYSGIFKERIEIYRSLLSRIFSIKIQIQRYQYSASEEEAKNIMENVNDFINFYLINQPFLSKKMIEQLTTMRIEFQDTFDKFLIFHKIGFNDSESSERRNLLDDYLQSGNKFKTNQPFKELEDIIISEMRKDLQTDK